MSPLLLLVVLSATPIVDPRGFQFTVPDGFTPFPSFEPSATQLYAYGKNLGTPDAITFTLDLVEGAVSAGEASRSCGALLNSIERTVGKPITQPWQSRELSGLRMVMTHAFGEVVVLCVDVPLSTSGLSVKVSGKPTNEAALQQIFEGVLSSLERPAPRSVLPLGGAAALLIIAIAVALRRRRRGTSPQ